MANVISKMGRFDCSRRLWAAQRNPGAPGCAVTAFPNVAVADVRIVHQPGELLG